MALPPKIFDRPLIARNLARRTATAPDFVTQLVLDDLDERLLTLSRKFEKALIMGPDGAVLPAQAQSSEGIFSFERVATLVGTPDIPVTDPDALALAHRDYDLIVSLLDLQTVNDVPGFLTQIQRHLAPDGLFLAAALGGNSLIQLRQAFVEADAEHSGGAFARVAPFIQVRDGGALLQRAGFALPVADVETHTVRYSSPIALIAELKAMGASNPLAERPPVFTTRSLLAAVSQLYGEQASADDGKVLATLEIIWLSGWAPHERQQKPLAPGSAKVSLKALLGDKS